MQEENMKNELGTLQIAKDVIATLTAYAATEVEGVEALNGNLSHDIIGQVGVKNNCKGIKVALNGKKVTVDLALIVKYGYSISKLAESVQINVTNAISNMLGFETEKINLKFVSVDMADA
ncbi:MAG: Asp23/Gls24 family envelope stress response protein [Lachnospiraceae bacterium]|nr:Asp23/Gls24 family envelope stress response protein [Lachnospiraceae bacterium]